MLFAIARAECNLAFHPWHTTFGYGLLISLTLLPCSFVLIFQRRHLYFNARPNQ